MKLTDQPRKGCLLDNIVSFAVPDREMALRQDGEPGFDQPGWLRLDLSRISDPQTKQLVSVGQEILAGTEAGAIQAVAASRQALLSSAIAHRKGRHHYLRSMYDFEAGDGPHPPTAEEFRAIKSEIRAVKRLTLYLRLGLDGGALALMVRT